MHKLSSAKISKSQTPKPTPATCQTRKTEVALQFSEGCAAETALQLSLFCSADVVFTRTCAATNEELHCNIEKAALQESVAGKWRFPATLSCGFQAPTFRLPRFLDNVRVLFGRVSRGLSAQQATELYSDNLLNCTRNPSKTYSGKDIPLRRAFEAIALLVGFSTGNPPQFWNFYRLEL